MRWSPVCGLCLRNVQRQHAAQFHVYLLFDSPQHPISRYFLDIVVVNQGRVSAALYNNGTTIKCRTYNNVFNQKHYRWPFIHFGSRKKKGRDAWWVKRSQQPHNVMDGVGPAAIPHYILARFQVFLKKKIKKELLFINLKKKNGSSSSRNVQEVKVHPSRASARGRHRVRSKICYRVSQRGQQKKNNERKSRRLLTA